MKNFQKIAGLAAALFAAAGCFNEPVSAEKTVPAGARIYLKGRALKTFAAADALAAQREPKVPVAEVDYLNLDYNELTNVDEVASFTGLRWLRLNGNRLESLPDLRALARLRRVYLRDNRLAAVPETLKDLPELTDVDLSGNPIAEVPRWLAEKRGLENLSFNGTQITNLPPDLSAWRSLKSLQLGGLSLSTNEMARIRAAFDPRNNPLGTAVVF